MTKRRDEDPNETAFRVIREATEGGGSMADASVFLCSHTTREEGACGAEISIAAADHVEGHEVKCQSCQRRSRLLKVPSPTHGDFGTRVWAWSPQD